MASPGLNLRPLACESEALATRQKHSLQMGLVVGLTPSILHKTCGFARDGCENHAKSGKICQIRREICQIWRGIIEICQIWREIMLVWPFCDEKRFWAQKRRSFLSPGSGSLFARGVCRAGGEGAQIFLSTWGPWQVFPKYPSQALRPYLQTSVAPVLLGKIAVPGLACLGCRSRCCHESARFQLRRVASRVFPRGERRALHPVLGKASKRWLLSDAG